MRYQKELTLAIGTAAFFVLVRQIVLHQRKKRHTKALQEQARQKIESVVLKINSTSTLPEISESLSSKILNSSILELQTMLSNSEISCVDIFLAYTHQIRTACMKHNCVVDADISLGLKRANKLDQELKTGKKRSSLHGIPISVKDMIAVKGLISSYGCAALSWNTQKEDAYLIRVLKKKGAVIYIKAAMTQNAAFYETVNSISGVTTNPFDKNRSSGGSSGGDAVLVALKGTCLGLGTDIGGSLRFPAISCGVYTLKPTSSRISRSGPMPLQDFPRVKNSWGPLAKNVDDIIVFFKEVLSVKPSGTLPWIQWNEELFTHKSRKIGYCLGSDYWPIPDCMKRAVLKAKQILESKGHTLVEFKLENELKLINNLKVGIYAYEPRDFQRLQGEEPLKHLKKIGFALSLPNFVKGFFEKYVRSFYGEKESFYYKSLSQKSADDYVQNLIEIQTLKIKFYDKLKNLGLENLLFPYPFPAILHDSSPDLLPGFSYLALFNVLDCPVGSVPIGVVSENEQNYPVGKELWTRRMNDVMTGSENLPIGVQVMGLPYREESVLNIMKELS